MPNIPPEPWFNPPRPPYGQRDELLSQIDKIQKEVRELQSRVDADDTVLQLIVHFREDDAVSTFLSRILQFEPALKHTRLFYYTNLSDDELSVRWSTLHRRKFILQNLASVLSNLTPLFESIPQIFESLHERIDPTYDPKALMPGRSLFNAPLVELVDNPRVVMQYLWEFFAESPSQAFYNVSVRLQSNLSNLFRASEKPLLPIDSTLPVVRAVECYFGGTPVADLLLNKVSARWDFNHRYTHTHILASTGQGKSTLLESIIYRDIMTGVMTHEHPSIVVIDPVSELIPKLSRVRLNADYDDRLIIINPRDMEYPIAVNLFAVNQERLAKYDEVTREQVNSGLIQVFDYFFSGMMGSDLTAKMTVPFRYMSRLLLSFPQTLHRNATIKDMLNLTQMSKKEPKKTDEEYYTAMRALPPDQRDFFENDFLSKEFEPTLGHIRYRLRMITESTVMSRFFTAPENKIDLFSLMNAGSIILIDTAKDLLQKSGSAILGRLWISLILQAIIERAVIDADQRTPTFLFIDEAADFFDNSGALEDFLSQARKFKCGITLAHHDLDHAPPLLRASLATNTRTKFAGGVSPADAAKMAADMRTTKEFIESQPQYHFATYIHGVTPHPISIGVAPTHLSDKKFYLSEAEYAARIRQNRQRVSLGVPVPEVNSPPSSPQPPEDDISKEW